MHRFEDFARIDLTLPSQRIGRAELRSIERVGIRRALRSIEQRTAPPPGVPPFVGRTVPASQRHRFRRFAVIVGFAIEADQRTQALRPDELASALERERIFDPEATGFAVTVARIGQHLPRRAGSFGPARLALAKRQFFGSAPLCHVFAYGIGPLDLKRDRVRAVETDFDAGSRPLRAKPFDGR